MSEAAWHHLRLELRWVESLLLTLVRQTQATPELPPSPHYLRREDVEPLLLRSDEDPADLRVAADDLARSVTADGSRLPLVELVLGFEINATEHVALLLAVLCTLRPDARPVIAYLQDDLQATQPRVGLVMQVTTGDPSAPASPWMALGGPPLSRVPGLTLTDASSLDLQVVEASSSLVRYLLGTPNIPESVTRWLAAPITCPSDAATEAAAAWLEALDRDRTVVGQFRTADAIDLHTALAQGGFSVLAFDPSANGEGSGAVDALKMAVAHATLTGSILSVGPVDPADDAILTVALASANSPRLTLALVGPELLDTRAIRSRRPVRVVDVRNLTLAERRSHWKRVAPDLCDDEIAEVSSRYAIGASLIEQAVRIASFDSGADALGAACREVTRAPLGGIANSIATTTRWEDLVLPLSTSLQLREMVGMLGSRELVFDTWKVRGKLSETGGISALFFGPPGTGKTLAASAVAGALGLPLLRVDLAGLISKYIGETEKNLRKVFRAARRTNAVLFFDEADAVFGKRTAVKDAHDRHANVQTSYLLQEVETYNGIAVLATNFKTNIDEAFLRRMDMVVEFPPPEQADRERLWHLLLPDTSGDLSAADVEGLARFKLSGGNIRNAVQDAAFLAAPDGEPPSLAHLHVAILAELAKVGRPQALRDLGSGARDAFVVQQQIRWRVLLAEGLTVRERSVLASGFELRDDDFLPAVEKAKVLENGAGMGLLEALLGVCLYLRDAGRFTDSPTVLPDRADDALERLFALELVAPDPARLCVIALEAASADLRNRYLDASNGEAS